MPQLGCRNAITFLVSHSYLFHYSVHSFRHSRLHISKARVFWDGVPYSTNEGYLRGHPRRVHAPEKSVLWLIAKADILSSLDCFMCWHPARPIMCEMHKPRRYGDIIDFDFWRRRDGRGDLMICGFFCVANGAFSVVSSPISLGPVMAHEFLLHGQVRTAWVGS